MEALGPEGVEWSGEESEVLKTWIGKPKVMVDLGRRLLEELSNELVVHVGSDYRRMDVRTDGQRHAKRARLV